MGFFNNIFSAGDRKINSVDGFWNWFSKNEKSFYKCIKSGNNIEKNFFEKLSAKLEELRSGIFYLSGMHTPSACELIFTAEGSVKNIFFIEELVNSAPRIEGWKFTALKQPLKDEEINDWNIQLGGIDFNAEKISFYSNESLKYPDEIDITIVHHDYTPEKRKDIITGTYNFLQNLLGELNVISLIDNLSFEEPDESSQDLIPVVKLKDYLNWRQKEFLEKYQSTYYRNENNTQTLLEGTEVGMPYIAVMNTGLLQSPFKSSYQWIVRIDAGYEGDDNNGMPDKGLTNLLDQFENKISVEMNIVDGIVSIGNVTGNNKREIFFACREFRKPSKIISKVIQNYSDKLNINYEIYKDKYWQTFSKFNDTPAGHERNK